MKCEDFLLKIDAYIDGELSDEEIKAMHMHAENCDSCRVEMAKAELLRDPLVGIDEDISVPLEAQAAWRRAVRVESKRKNVRKWTRGLYVVAAALVVVLGCTLIMNNDIFADKRAFTTGVQPEVAAMKGAAPRTAVMIATDGDEAAAVESYTAVKKYAVRDFAAAEQLIRDLAAEYGAVSVDKSDSGEQVSFIVELPIDYQEDFLSALGQLGDELVSELFEAGVASARVRVTIAAE